MKPSPPVRPRYVRTLYVLIGTVSGFIGWGARQLIADDHPAIAAFAPKNDITVLEFIQHRYIGTSRID
jgi:hypothetical protein